MWLVERVSLQVKMLSELATKCKFIGGDTNSRLGINETDFNIVVLEVIWT